MSRYKLLSAYCLIDGIILIQGGITGFLGSLKISLCEVRRLKDTQNLKWEDRRFQNCLVLKTEILAIKPSSEKIEDLHS